MLRRAQKKLASPQTSGSDSDSDDSENDPSSKRLSVKGKERERSKATIEARRNKHAPTEVTSKKPVSRRRVVVESNMPQARDPRFLQLAGGFSTEKYRHNYGFLSDLHSTELSELRANLKRARKLLVNSPRHLREERQAEVERLELAIKRAESAVNRDKRERIESQALKRVTQEEKEKRKIGKGDWHMKRSAKKELLVKARFDSLAASGGRQAVKKAIEKKQRKISQKEKKSRPFAPPSSDSSKRKRGTEDSGRPRKRAK